MGETLFPKLNIFPSYFSSLIEFQSVLANLSHIHLKDVYVFYKKGVLLHGVYMSVITRTIFCNVVHIWTLQIPWYSTKMIKYAYIIYYFQMFIHQIPVCNIWLCWATLSRVCLFLMGKVGYKSNKWINICICSHTHTHYVQ